MRVLLEKNIYSKKERMNDEKAKNDHPNRSLKSLAKVPDLSKDLDLYANDYKVVARSPGQWTLIITTSIY